MNHRPDPLAPIDPIELAVFHSAVHSIAEEMGAALRRTAISPNIKERRDYSCAVFDGLGRVIAMGDHMPVHLGSMPMSVEAAVAAIAFAPGDIAILNDPYAGGTHLPDITMVLPVFTAQEPQPAFYVASRAHHADVGGAFAGSMGPAREIFEEGIRIPPVRIVRGGEVNQELLDLILLNVRTPTERRGDLDAQIGACRVGELRALQLLEKYGRSKIDSLIDNSSATPSGWLVRSCAPCPPVPSVRKTGWMTTASPQHRARSLSSYDLSHKLARYPSTSPAPPLRSRAASTLYAPSLPPPASTCCAACWQRMRLPPLASCARSRSRRPPGSIVDARPPAPVAGGNVETSQRIVDVLLRALAQAMPARVPSARAGTMSNLTIGGIDPRTSEPFTYYETTAGGMGARPTLEGISGVQTHMTNSLNTPIEALEYAYPFRVRRYAYRDGSGGAGRFRGGDGLIRELELLSDAQVTLLADRRSTRPYGLQGGEDGAPGRASITDPAAKLKTDLPGKCTRRVSAGTILRIETPGGGGWGAA
jgi:N-methylhydantoinase B